METNQNETNAYIYMRFFTSDNQYYLFIQKGNNQFTAECTHISISTMENLKNIGIPLKDNI